jgi:hypothetical protein
LIDLITSSNIINAFNFRDGRIPLILFPAMRSLLALKRAMHIGAPEGGRN